MSVVAIEKVCGPHVTASEVDKWIALQPKKRDKDFLQQLLKHTRNPIVIAKIVALSPNVVRNRVEGELPIHVAARDWELSLVTVQVLVPTAQPLEKDDADKLLEIALRSHCSSDVIFHIITCTPSYKVDLLNKTSFRKAMLLWRGYEFVKQHCAHMEPRPYYSAVRLAILRALFRDVRDHQKFMIVGLEDCLCLASDGSLPIHRVETEVLVPFLTSIRLCPEALEIPDDKGMLPLHRNLFKETNQIVHECMYLGSILSQVPTKYLRTILDKYPQAARITDGEGNLPLHLALRRPIMDDEITRFIWKAYPEAVRCPDGTGRLPLHIILERYWDRHHEELSKNSLPLFKSLLKAYPEACRVPDETGSLPLHRAVHHPALDENATEALLNQFPEAARHACTQGWTPLHALVRRGTGPWQEAMDMVAERLIEEYPENCTIQDNLGRIPLHYAMSLSSQYADATPSMILAAYSDGIRVRDKNGETPFFNALRNSPTDAMLIIRLLKLYPDVLKLKNKDGMYPLHCLLARKGHVAADVATYMFESYPDAGDETDKKGNTPLHYAVQHAELDANLSLTLVSRKPDSCRLQGVHKQLPIHCLLLRDIHPTVASVQAAERSNQRHPIGPNCVPLLMKMIDAYPECCKVRDEGGKLPLHISVIERELDSNVSLGLIEKYPAALRAPSEDGRLPMHYLVARGGADNPAILLFAVMTRQNPDSLRAVDELGNTPLHRAIRCPPPSGFQGLSFAGVALKAYPKAAEIPNNDGQLPLHTGIACLSDHRDADSSDLRGVLHVYRKACETPDKTGSYPLHHAVKAHVLDDGFTMEVLKCYPQAACKPGANGQYPMHALLNRYHSRPIRPKLVKALLKVYRTACSVPDSQGRLPMHYAVNHSHLDQDLLIELLDAFPDAAGHEDSIHGDFPVHALIRRDRDDDLRREHIFSKLISIYPEAAAKVDSEGNSPVHYALKSRSLDDLSTKLVDRFPDVVGQLDSFGNMAFHVLLKREVASSNADLAPLLERLLAMCPKVCFETDYDDYLPLHLSLRNELFDDTVSERLVKLHPGALRHEISIVCCPIHILSHRVVQNRTPKNIEMVRRYIKYCPEACAQRDSSHGSTVLHLLVQSPPCDKDLSLEVVEACPKALEVRDAKGRLPIHVLLQRGSPTMGVALLKRMLAVYPHGFFTLSQGPRAGLLPVECAVKINSNYTKFFLNKMPELFQTRDPGSGDVLLHRVIQSSHNSLLAMKIFESDPSVACVKNNAGLLPIHLLVTTSKKEHRQNFDLVKRLIAAYPEGATTRAGSFEVPFLRAAELERSVGLIYELIRIDPLVAIRYGS